MRRIPHQFRRRRLPPELFGLSTLDTVTCALAGSIVLLIFMAAFTEGEAEIVITEHRIIFQSGIGEQSDDEENDETTGAEAPQMRNLAVIFFDYPDLGPFPDAQIAGRVDRTRVRDCENLLVSPLRAAGAHYPGEESGRVGYAIWQGTAGRPCTRLVLTIVNGRREPCAVTLVAGAHYQRRRMARCPSTVPIVSNGDGVYRLSGPI